MTASEKIMGLIRLAGSELITASVIALAAAIILGWSLNESVSASKLNRENHSNLGAQSQGANGDYSKFKHDNPQHARLPCLLCHRRENKSARPTLPGKSEHAPCAGCHAQQFNNSAGPICTICHTDDGKLKSFPRLSSFNMKFDHARHLRMRNVTCAACHQPLRGGVAVSIPAWDTQLRYYSSAFRRGATPPATRTPGPDSGRD